jgi:hypothetical protein
MRVRTALRRARVAGPIAGLLALTALLPFAPPPAAATGVITEVLSGALSWPVALVAAVAAAAALAVGRFVPATRAAAVAGTRLVLHLWPVLLLTVIYPVASHRMADHDVGGVALTTFLLAVALTVPWLIQGACMPMYRILGELVASDDVDALRRRFCAAWPTAFVGSVPVLVVAAAPLGLVLGWSPTAIGAFLLLGALNVLFAQVLVLANLGPSRVGWAVAWTAYSLPVLVVPTLWYLPPLLGLLVCSIRLARHLGTRPVRLSGRDLTGDVVRGLLLGSVMWADKVFYFFSSAGQFPVATVFLALLPAVLAYNYYFICMAPAFDASVARLRTAMQSESLGALGDCSRAVSRTVTASLRRTALVGAVFVCVASWVLAAVAPGQAALIASVSIASWLFAMITVVCYKVDYVGERRPGQVVGVVHVAVCAAAFLLLPLGATAYLAVLGIEVLALVAVVVVFRRVFRAPEYTVFWRHALAW